MQLYKFRQIHQWLLFSLLSAIKSIGSTFHDKVKLPVFCSSSVAGAVRVNEKGFTTIVHVVSAFRYNKSCIGYTITSILEFSMHYSCKKFKNTGSCA